MWLRSKWPTGSLSDAESRSALVVIEQNKELIREHEKIRFVTGDARQDAVLQQANI